MVFKISNILWETTCVTELLLIVMPYWTRPQNLCVLFLAIVKQIWMIPHSGCLKKKDPISFIIDHSNMWWFKLDLFVSEYVLWYIEPCCKISRHYHLPLKNSVQKCIKKCQECNTFSVTFTKMYVLPCCVIRKQIIVQ